jgi:hypothetical protein
MTEDNIEPLEKPIPQSMGSRDRQLTPELQTEFKLIAAMDTENGLVKPENVLKRAESATSPLHGFFTWDDEKAAEEWRIMQARYLIRSFKVEIEPLVIVPAFVSLGTDRTNGGGYRWTGEVLPQVDLKKNLMLTVLSDMENLLRKLEDMPEMKPLMQMIVSLREKITQSK